MFFQCKIYQSELHTTLLGPQMPTKPKKVKQPVSAYNFYSMEQRADKKKVFTFLFSLVFSFSNKRT